MTPEDALSASLGLTEAVSEPAPKKPTAVRIRKADLKPRDDAPF